MSKARVYGLILLPRSTVLIEVLLPFFHPQKEVCRLLLFSLAMKLRQREQRFRRVFKKLLEREILRGSG